MIGHGLVAPDDIKVKCIKEYPVPLNVKQLQQFLGMVGFYRNFCKNFSHIATPLTNLLKKGKQFLWSEDCNKAFIVLKNILCNEPVLKTPNFQCTFKLITDASDIAAAAVLAQDDDDGVEHPVCFYSKKFNIHQQRYSTIEKETLAVILGLKHFDVYIDNGLPIIIYTDHNTVTFLHKMKGKYRRLFCWSLFIQEYDIIFKHIKGSENVVSDALSRI